MPAVHLTVPELADWLAVGRAHEDLGAAVGAPVAVLDAGGVADDDPLLARVAAATRSLPCVLVAGRGLDALVDVHAAGDDLASVVATAEAVPLAAAAFVLLLRGGATRTVDEGLVAESTTYSMLQGGPEFAAWRAGRPVRHRPEPDGPAVLLERRAADPDAVHVVLNRPHVHNALDARLRDGLADAFAAVAADPSIERVVLRGNGRSFCSGGDLDTFGSFPDPATAHALRLARSPARALAAVAGRVEAHLHGSCLGAGIELSAFAARVVADPDARLGLPELALGLVPGAGGTVSLPRRIGRHRTALLGLRGGTVDAATALAWGLVDAVASIGPG